MELLTYSGPLECVFSHSAHVPKSFIIAALLSYEWSAATQNKFNMCTVCETEGLLSKRINRLSLLIGNARTYIGLLFGDPTQIFLQRLSGEADAEKSSV